MKAEDLLSDEEKAIQDTARQFSQEVLLPKVTEMYRNESEYRPLSSYLFASFLNMLIMNIPPSISQLGIRPFFQP